MNNRISNNIITLQNITKGYYAENLIVDFSLESSTTETKATIKLPYNIFVLSPKPVIKKGIAYDIATAQEILDENIYNCGNDTSSLITSSRVTSYIDPLTNNYIETEVLYKYTLKNSKLNVYNTGKKYTKLSYTNSFENNDISNLVYMFNVGDILKIKLERISPFKPEDTLNYKPAIINTVTEAFFYINGVTKENNILKIDLTDYSFQLKQLPITISTKNETSILNFLENYLIYPMLKYTDMQFIIIKEFDYNIFRDSNIGQFRANVTNFYALLEEISKKYFIKFVTSPYGYGSIRFRENSGFKKTSGVAQIINAQQYITEESFKNINPNELPVLIRVSSKGKGKTKEEKKYYTYGEKSAVASGNGVILTYNLGNISQIDLKNFAKNAYIKQKYLNNLSQITSKLPIYSNKIIRYNTCADINNNGFYFVLKVAFTFNITNGFTAKAFFGYRFEDNTLIKQRLGIDGNFYG